MNYHPFLSDDDRVFVPKELLKDIHRQLMLNVVYTAKRDGFETISNYLKNYFKDTFNAINPERFKYYLDAHIAFSDRTLRRAITGKEIDKFDIKYELLDFLCNVCWPGKTLPQCILDTKYLPVNGNIDINELTLYAVDIPEYAKIEIAKYLSTDSLKLEEVKPADIPDNLTSQPIIRKPKNIQFLDNDFWDKYILPVGNDRDKKVSRFYTHTDSNLVRVAIANNEIVEPSPILEVKDGDENAEEKTFSQILDTAKSQSFALIKLICDGGVGKTTLLYWLAHKFKESYNFVYIEHIKKGTSSELIYSLTSLLNNSKPVVFLFDNAANAGVSKRLIEFIEDIKSDLSHPEITFILAERTPRYKVQFEDEAIERLFNGNIQSIETIPIDKARVFEKVYFWLKEENPLLNDEILENASRGIFLSKTVNSISESTFHLIKNLKLNNKIVYDFDWDDFIKNSPPDYSNLQNLFIIVSTFYQFGIKLPITFKASDLGKANRLTIIKAIKSFGLEKSPILLADENDYLILKHEHIATWFLHEKGNDILAQGFFRNFVSEIDNEVSAKLIRKIRKASRLKDFKESCIAQVFNPATYLEIINQYLGSPTISSDEKEKMLTEKGIALLNLGSDFETEAVKAFQEVIVHYPANNHARDQLAKIYLKSPSTFQLALNKYIEIYNNGGLYAMVEIYKLLKKCKREGISFEYNSKILLSIEAINALIKECISLKDFKLAAEILQTIKVADEITAECHNLLAHRLKFTIKNIEIKRRHYLKAIEISNSCSSKLFHIRCQVDYAVFLYRIREFSESTAFIDKACWEAPDEEKGNVMDMYRSKIRSITKLFIPLSENLVKLKEYFLRQFENVAALTSYNQTNVENIIKGTLVLQTVRVHSKYIIPEIYYAALLKLAYCHAYHADKQWNNFSPSENRAIAESYYDWVFYKRGFLEQRELKNMIKNLLNFIEKERSLKAIRLIRDILRDKKDRYVPVFYRYLGNAKLCLEDYEGAMKDYEEAITCSNMHHYEKESYYDNEMACILNDKALLICECIEKKIVIKGFTLKMATQYCDQIEDHNPHFDQLKLTRQKIKSLGSNNSNNNNSQDTPKE